MKGFVIQTSYEDENGFERISVEHSDEHSLFMILFKDILVDIGGLYWVSGVNEAPFSSGSARDEAEMESFYFDLIKEYERSLQFDLVSPPYSIFPKHARWIRDNNTTLLGFHNRPDETLVERLKEIWLSDHQAYFEIVDVYFSNEDGIFWECFARDDALLNRALASALKVIDRKFINLMDSDDWKAFWNERYGLL